jgi:hypothetical protein
MLIIKVKPTKHNKKQLEKRGLFSDDSQSWFNLYQSILDSKEFIFHAGNSLMDEIRFQYFSDELLRNNIKFS